MAAALTEADAPALHAQDTVAAGAGLVDAKRAELMTAEGVAAVERLAALGVPFDRDAKGALVPSLEAAHAMPRVARVKGDQAGRAIMEAVTAAALAAPHIEVRQGARAVALLKDKQGRVRGALVDQDGRLTEITAAATILATGGIGGLYAVTTTPAELKGEGLALAALAGAEIADPEFVQFHPTAIDIGRDPAPLATEALRGEGAVLINGDGQRFMARYHPDAELAPRDVVARAIYAERAAGRGAFLDARAAIGAHFPEEFPAVFAACMGGGIDPRVQPIPVAPACHYHMGGIATDALGHTSLAGLYAAGECASTGVHGANRLASNSLLEAAVFGARAGRTAAGESDPKTAPTVCVAAPDLPPQAVTQLRQAMSRDAGVVRTAAGLTRLLGEIDALETAHGRAAPLVAARLVAACALARTESRGGHYRTDGTAPQPSHRTFLHWADLPAASTLRYAAE
jgi:L-aspartate oxidase